MFRKILPSVLGLAVLTMGVIACNSDIEVENVEKNIVTNKESSPDSTSFTLREEITVYESTDLISELFYKLGGEGISVIENSDGLVEFQVQTERDFYLNDEVLNFSNYEFVLDNEFLTVIDEEGLQVELSLLQGEPYIRDVNYEGLLESTDINENKIVVGLILMKEIILEDSAKSTAVVFSSQSGGCSIWDKYYVNAYGNTRGESELTFEEGKDSYTGEGGRAHGCREYGEKATSCLWDNHFCLTTQAYCCD